MNCTTICKRQWPVWRNMSRSFSASSVWLKPKITSAQQAKSLQRLKRRNKVPPQQHPLYMDISKALKYIRASEVGQHASKTTITLAISVIGEQGSKPLSGFIDLPHPVSKSKVLIFSNHGPEIKSSLSLNESDYTIGGPELIELIKASKFNIDSYTHAFCTHDIVTILNPINRVLASKNLTCHTRKGNVVNVDQVAEVVNKNLSSIPFKQRTIHVAFPVGRCDFLDRQILENIQAASKKIHLMEPSGTKKPNLIGQTVISSTRGPGLVINFT